MYHQLLTYKMDASTSPRKPGSSARSSVFTQTATTASITNSAGSSLLALRSQKSPSRSRPLLSHWPSRMSVMR